MPCTSLFAISRYASSLGAWVLAHFFKQPLTLAYLIAGFFIGPFGMGWVKSQEQSVSSLDLTFMLFMMGLKIDVKKGAREPDKRTGARVTARWTAEF